MEASLNPGLGISCVHDLVALMTVSGFSAQKILALYLKAFFWRKGHAWRSDKVRYYLFQQLVILNHQPQMMANNNINNKISNNEHAIVNPARLE
jgi:hypothetical protein